MFGNPGFGGFQANANPLQMNPQPQSTLFSQPAQNNVIALPDASNLASFQQNAAPTFGMANQQQQGGSLFGNKQQAQQTGGLFGGAQTGQGFGLSANKFGGGGMMQMQGGNAMGTPQLGGFGQQKPMGFGTQQTAPAPGGLFGAQTQNANPNPGFGLSLNTVTPAFGQQQQSGPAPTSAFGFGQQPNASATIGGQNFFGERKAGSFGFGNTGTQIGATSNQPAFGGNQQMGGLVGFGGSGFTSAGLGQQQQGFGMGQQAGVQRSGQGTMALDYQMRKNAKNNNVHSIRYMPQYQNVPLSVLRMQDYTMHKANQVPNPQITTVFNNYLQVSSGAQAATAPGMSLGMGNTMTPNAGFGNVQQNSLMGQPALLGGQKPGGLFNAPGLLTSNVINSQPTQPFGSSANVGGLFGKPQAPAGNLLGNTQSLNTGGLFSTAPANPSGGLFNATAPANPSGGLFNTTAPSLTQNANTGGIFGGNAGAQTNQLFGGNAPATGGLFSGNPGITAQQGFNGGMGQLGLTQQKPAPSLFGGNAGGGLFNTPSQPTGGLFNAAPSGGLFGDKPTVGNVNLFAPQQPMAQPALGLQPSTTQNVTGVSNTIQLPSLEGLRSPYCIYIVPGQPAGQFGETVGSLAPRQNYGELMDEFSSFRLRREYADDEEEQYRRANSAFYEYPELARQAPVIRANKRSRGAFRPFLRAPQEQTGRGVVKFINDVPQHNADRFEPVAVKSFLRREDEEDDAIRLRVVVEKGDETAEVAEYFRSDALVAEIVQFLAKKRGIIPREDVRKYKVYKDEHELDSLFSLDEYSLQHGDTVHVRSAEAPPAEEQRPAAAELQPKRSQKYTTRPAFKQLEKMTEAQLRAVPGFTVIGEHATLEFEEPVDLRGVDIDRTVRMSHKMVEVYPDGEEEKPKVGEKLNKPAFITFNNFKLGKQASKSRYVAKLKELAASMNATVIDVDKKNDTLKIYVEHF